MSVRLHVRLLGRKRHAPPSSDTSSMSDVTDIRCAVRSGDFVGAASPAAGSALSSTFLGMLGTSGTGESALLSCAADDEEPGLLMSDREDRERSEWESGRGVISEASSKSSCRNTQNQQVCISGYRPRFLQCSDLRPLYPSCVSSSAGALSPLPCSCRPW